MSRGGPASDAPREISRALSFIRRVVARAAAKGVVVGLSGGVDSSVTGALCVRALGKENVMGLLMPSDHTPKEDIADAVKLAKTWGIRYERIPISEIAEKVAQSAKVKGTKIARANIEARVRMTVLYYYANSLGYLVAGTDDRSESLLGYFCYDDRTRVVTKRGPRGIDELKEGDAVFSYDLASRKVKESEVDGVFVFNYNGRMINFRSSNADLMVTPNHRMLVSSSSTGDYQYVRPIYRTAEECLERKLTILPVPVGWDGDGSAPTALQVTFSQEHVDRTVAISTEDLLFVFGLFIRVGCAIKGKVVVPVKPGLTRAEFQAPARDSIGRFLTFSQVATKPKKPYDSYETDFALPDYSNGHARQQLVRILVKYGIGYSSTRNVVRVPSKGLFDLFSQCGFGARQKHIPQWILEYPSKYLYWLLRGLRASDGSKGGAEVYHIGSSQLKDDLVQLCVKLGKLPKVRVRSPETSKLKNGQVIRSGASYEVTCARKTKRSRTIVNSNARKVRYAGRIWCPSVPPFENMLVERNGNYAFCGNTKFGDGGVDFLPISHLYKTQVRALGASLGLPAGVVHKPASPQLWPGHKASDEIPADYDRLDIALHSLFDLKRSPMEAARTAGLDLEAVERVMQMHRRTGHKRKMPPSLS